MDKEIIKKLMSYYFKGVDWKYLTNEEREIIKTEENYKEFKEDLK